MSKRLYKRYDTQKFQKLMYLHLFTDCFMKISPQSSEQIRYGMLISGCLKFVLYLFVVLCDRVLPVKM